MSASKNDLNPFLLVSCLGCFKCRPSPHPLPLTDVSVRVHAHKSVSFGDFAHLSNHLPHFDLLYFHHFASRAWQVNCMSKQTRHACPMTQCLPPADWNHHQCLVCG